MDFIGMKKENYLKVNMRNLEIILIIYSMEIEINPKIKEE
jgi:hypothetical protein